MTVLREGGGSMAEGKSGPADVADEAAATIDVVRVLPFYALPPGEPQFR
jgi:hypothetical protein